MDQFDDTEVSATVDGPDGLLAVLGCGTTSWAGAKEGQAPRDAAFIAAARTALPEALSEIERLNEENEVLRECAAECGREHLAEIERLTAALAKAEHERNLATVEAIGHAHSEGHLSSLVDEQREEIERLTAERDRLANLYDEEVRLTRRALAEHVRESRAQERNLAQELSRADRLSRELDRHIDALASLGHLPDDAEHTRWCEPCRRVREGGGT
jgi:DNA repair exonuclease SbcCD ATPase subunit